MAKVTITGFPKVKANIQKTFDSIRKDPELLAQIATASKDNIVGFARSGKNPEDKSNFPRLSQTWVEKRSYLKKYNSPDSEFFLDSTKSNLTFTGTLLKSIKARIVRSSASVIIEATGDHPGYKTKNESGKSVKNSDLVGYLEDKGFVFLRVSEQLRKRVNVLTKAFIRRLIRKNK